jgi:hypothetical protein
MAFIFFSPKHPDGKMMQIMLTGFLGKTRAKTFMTDLIDLLTGAMESPDGIPNELVELKKLELQKKKVLIVHVFCTFCFCN